jgi:hypothetical protein
VDRTCGRVTMPESSTAWCPSARRRACVTRSSRASGRRRKRSWHSMQSLVSKATRQADAAETHEAVAVYTTAGMSIARITLVDEAGAELYDKLIAPGFAVLDLNTRCVCRGRSARMDAHHALTASRASSRASSILTICLPCRWRRRRPRSYALSGPRRSWCVVGLSLHSAARSSKLCTGRPRT